LQNENAERGATLNLQMLDHPSRWNLACVADCGVNSFNLWSN